MDGDGASGFFDFLQQPDTEGADQPNPHKRIE
jgi:hypothetical protein